MAPTGKSRKAKATTAKRRSQSAARRARGRDEAEGYGEDDDDLRRKGQWFRLLRDLPGDVALADLRAAALRQVESLASQSLDAFAPAMAELRVPFEIVTPERTAPRVRGVDDPAPRSTWGAAGPAVEVDDHATIVGARLLVRVDAAQRVAAGSVRMFRYEATSRRWVLVPRSGTTADGTVAWVALHRSGRFMPIGLPADPQRLRVLWMLYMMKPLLRRLGAAGKLDALREVFAQRATIGDLLHELGDDPDVAILDAGLLSARSGRLPGLPSGLGNGMPEFDLLDDICPPWRGDKRWLPPEELLLPEFRRWVWPPFLWGWHSAGPTNFSGRIKSVAVCPTNRNVVYAGAADGGVWKSVNGATTWQPTMFTELSMAIGAIDVARTQSSTVYAATGEDTPGWGPSYPGVGVYKSIDAGLSWTLTGSGVVGGRCTRVLVDPTDAQRVFVATNWGLYRTTDGGTTWTSVLAGHISDALMEPTNPNRLFAAIWNDGVYRSLDGGATWQRAGTGSIVVKKGFIFRWGRLPTGTDAEWIKLAMGLNGLHGPNYVLAKMGKDSGVVYRSTDGGTAFFAFAGTHQPASYNEWTNMVAVHRDNHDIVFAGGVGVERSTNGGTSFAGIGGTHSDHHQIAFDPVDANVCYMATDGGVYKSTNAGATWALVSSALIATQLYSIGVSQAGAFKLGGGTQDQGIIATEGPAAWRDTSAGNEGGFFVVDPNSSANIYTTPWSNNLRRSRDGGFTWTDIRNGMTEVVAGVTTDPAGVAHIAVKPGDSNLLIAVGVITAPGYYSARIFRSTDQGDNWTSVTPLDAAGLRVAFAPSSAARVFVATASGRVFRSDSSGTFGSFAEPYIAADRPTTAAISALAVGWNDANLVWIGCGGWGGARVLRSTDGGATWTNRTGTLPADQLPNMPVNSLVIDQNNPDVVYVATDVGIFRTQDAGASWQPYNDGFLNFDVPRIIVTELALRRSTNTLYAGTMGRGAYRRAL